MYKKGSNQHIKYQKLELTQKNKFALLICAIFALLVTLLGREWVWRHPTMSPVPENPHVSQEESNRIIKRAFAAETLKKQEEATPENIITYISKVFAPEGTEIMFRAIHIAKNESGLRVNAKGYNCRYNGVSKACKVEDRANAWSVDCGIFQHNVIGQSCPTMSWKQNVDKAYALYKRRGFTPWVVALNLGY